MDNTRQQLLQMQQEVDNVMKEFEVLAKSIDLRCNEFTEEVTRQLEKLDKVTKALSKEAVVINTTPRKLSDQLEKIIPDIASELNNLVSYESEQIKLSSQQAIAEHNKSLSDAALNLKVMKDEISRIDSQRITRYFMGLCSVVLISVCASISASYLMIQKFPHNVNIESPGKVEVQNSEVSLWHSKTVSTSGKEKTMKY